jgi:hypothetical protein
MSWQSISASRVAGGLGFSLIRMSDIDQTDTAIAAAFEELRREVSLARAAVEGLTAARERVPDYSVTLGQIADRLTATAAAADRIEKAPAVRLSPDAMMAEIVKASAAARAADARLIQEARDALSQSLGRVDGLVKRGQVADQQIRHLYWAAGGGMLIGILIWSVLPGAIARSLPASWHVPEWMAARTMGAERHQGG